MFMMLPRWWNVGMVKRQIRVLGIDDGPFSFGQKETVIIGVVMRANGYMEGILRRNIDVDGTNSTDAILDMINKTRHKDQIRVIMIDGIALGGFNVVDIRRVYTEGGIPVITVTREKPNFDTILSTLKMKFSDWKERWEKIKGNEIFEIETKHKPIYISCKGLSIKEAKEIIKISTIRGVIPEPLRVAHMIASGVVRGESYGKA